MCGNFDSKIMLVHGDMTSCTDLAHHHVVDLIAIFWQQLLYSCSKYFHGKHCFLQSTMLISIIQNFRAILAKVIHPSNATRAN